MKKFEFIMELDQKVKDFNFRNTYRSDIPRTQPGYDELLKICLDNKEWVVDYCFYRLLDDSAGWVIISILNDFYPDAKIPSKFYGKYVDLMGFWLTELLRKECGEPN